MLVVASVIARLLVEPGATAPDLVDDNILLIRRGNVAIGDGCTPGDGGVGDGGVPSDAGSPDASDAAGPFDAGGPSDGGVPPDAGCTANPGDAITLVIKPNVSIAAGVRFAVLFVTPSRPILETIADPFPTLAQVTAPVTVEHETYVQDPKLGTRCDVGAGCNFQPQDQTGPADWSPPAIGDANLGDGAVVVEPVGPYEIVRAQPADPAELATWLDQLGYAYAQADLDAVAPYIARGYTVVAVRIATGHASGGALAPIALTWAGSTLSLPAALGTGSATATTVYIAADGRFDLPGGSVSFADYTVTGMGGIGSTHFLTRNEVVLAPSDSPDTDPVAAAVLGDPVFVTTIVENVMVRVPVTDCSEQLGCCPACNTQRRPRADMGILAAAVLFAIGRRRRRVGPHFHN